MKLRTLLSLLLITALPLTAGCATVKGFGRDVTSVGEAGSEAIGN
ncbi:MAG: entericidin A/B family lipoprotein [Sphingobium sp.]|nr:entericidin A/B family lipoprotein [Sphingobium sp.]